MASINIRPSKGMFNDAEVGTAAHDSIVNCLANPTNYRQAYIAVHEHKPESIGIPRPSLHIERPITKGRTQFLLGFADLVIEDRLTTLVEVKTGEIRTGELLRQINAYREAALFHSTWLVTPQALDADTVDLLWSQGVTYVHFARGADGAPVFTAEHARAQNWQNHHQHARQIILGTLEDYGKTPFRNEVSLEVSGRPGQMVTLAVKLHMPAYSATPYADELEWDLEAYFAHGVGGVALTVTREDDPAAKESVTSANLPAGFWDKTE